MANTAQANKRARQANKRRQVNMVLRSKLRTYVKKVVNALDKKLVSEANTAYTAAIPVIDSMVNKGIIHRNKAARHKSRLNARLKQLQAESAN